MLVWDIKNMPLKKTNKKTLTFICLITLLTLSKRTSDFSFTSATWFHLFKQIWLSSALLPIIRESKTATSIIWENVKMGRDSGSQIAEMPFVLLLIRTKQALTEGVSLSSSCFFFFRLLPSSTSSSSSSWFSFSSGSGGRQKSCFSLLEVLMLGWSRTRVRPGRGGTL